MLNVLHHIHLICDYSDVSLHALQDHLYVYFEPRAHLTHDLFLMRPESSAYSWQCINACDYAFLLIGDSYGQLANTGVSQLHISYLNAKTKNKPMVALIKKAVGSDKPVKDSRQLTDFISLVGNQLEHIFLFDDNTNLTALVEKAYQTIKENHPIAEVPALSPLEEPDVITLIPTAEPSVSPPTPSEKPTNHPHPDSELILNCNAHAFQDGTLIEVNFSAVSSWRQILKTCGNTSFSTQGFWKILNDIVTPQAMPAILPVYPKVHAISRCQVIRSNMLHLQDVLIDAGWIERISDNKEVWQLSDHAKILI